MSKMLVEIENFAGWENVPLGHLVTITTGKKDVNEGAEDGEYPFFTCSRKAARSHSYSFDTEAILIAGNGEVGHLQYYSGKFEAYQRTYVLTDFEASSGYLRHFIQGFFTDHLATQHAGSVIQFIKLKDLTDFSIRLPKDESEQNKIIEILDTLDTQIRQTEAIIAKLQQVKQGLLHDLLTRGIDANGQLRPPRDQAPELYKESPLGWIPREWIARALKEISSTPICYGIVQVFGYVPGGVPVLAIRDLLGDYTSKIHRTDPSIDAGYVRSRVKGGDVLISVKGTIGRIGLVPPYFEGNISRDIAKIRPVSDVESGFLTYMLRSPFGQRILGFSKVGTTRAELSIAPLKELVFPCPPYEEQKEISMRLDKQERLISQNTAMLDKLKKQKSGLMDDLLTGRVRVTSLLDTAKAS